MMNRQRALANHRLALPSARIDRAARGLRAVLLLTGLAGLALGGAAACSPGDIVIVTVDRRASVQGVTSLSVSVANGADSVSEDFSLAGITLPATFSVSTGSREGELSIGVSALDAAGAQVGTGNVIVPIGTGTTEVTLNPMDFVVNTEFVGPQYLHLDYDTNGFQMAAASDVVTIGFRDDCPQGICNQYGRRFGADAQPLFTDLAAGTPQFRFNNIDGAQVANVGVSADSAGNAVALWDAQNGVTCRAVAADGVSSAAEAVVAAEVADVVSATPLANGNFATTWIGNGPAVRAAVISRGCATVNTAFTIGSPISFVGRPAVTASANQVLYTWIEDNADLRYRLAGPGGLPTDAMLQGRLLVPSPGLEQLVESARAVPIDDDFYVAYAIGNFTDGYQLRGRRLTATGELRGVDTVIGQSSIGALAIARGADGSIAVVWEDCTVGDGSACGIFGRLIRPDGLPASDVFVVNSTTDDDQIAPSIVALSDGFVVAYEDYGIGPPDVSPSGVRARYIYPSYDALNGSSGDRCDDAHPCRDGYGCTLDRDDTARCHEMCDITAGDENCLRGGGVCTSTAIGDACLFPDVLLPVQ